MPPNRRIDELPKFPDPRFSAKFVPTIFLAGAVVDFFFCSLEIYVKQVVYVLRRTGSGKLPLDVIMSIEASHS